MGLGGVFKLVTPCFGALQTGFEGVVIVIGEGVSVGFKLGLVDFDGMEEGGAIGGGDGSPECGVAGGDACGVAQPRAGERLPFGRGCTLEGAGEGGGENVRQVAGVGDNGVVCFRGCRDGFHPEALPVAFEGFECVGRGCFRGSKNAGPVFKQVGSGVFEPGFFGACHGV